MKSRLRLSLGGLILLFLALAGYFNIERIQKSYGIFLKDVPYKVQDIVLVKKPPRLTIRRIGLRMSEREVICILGKPKHREVREGTGKLSYKDPLLHCRIVRSGANAEFAESSYDTSLIDSMEVFLTDSRVDWINGFVLEINGHEKLRRGDRPYLKPIIFSLLGEEDTGNPGMSNSCGESEILSWSLTGSDQVLVYSSCLQPGDPYKIPFWVDFIVLH
ncbi:MAG: hypothetical protein NTZ48_07460 [Candidatus Omnitrophica bacterium]|nr:hypothetical protein [Candidatus Omnitrophota bacterium]